MVNLDSITIVGLLFVAVFGVEAFTDNSLWSEPGTLPDTYDTENSPSYGDNTQVTQLVESPEEAFRMMEAMNARTRRRMSPFSAMRGKRDNKGRRRNRPRSLRDHEPETGIPGKRAVPDYNTASDFEYQLLLRKVLEAAMSLSNNQANDAVNPMGKRKFGFHALRGR